MGFPATAVYQPVTVEVPGFGKLALAPQPDSPLLMVFGGIDVAESVIDPADKAHAKQMVSSGVYMWKYFSSLRSRYHVFVAHTHKVSGALAYRYVLYTLEHNGFPPPVCPAAEPKPFSGPSQVLYLFSGGYKPGMDLLKTYPVKLFSSISLVDIWMGSQSVASYYETLAAANAGKTSYIHTAFGANNPAARDSIARKVAPARYLSKAAPTNPACKPTCAPTKKPPPASDQPEIRHRCAVPKLMKKERCHPERSRSRSRPAQSKDLRLFLRSSWGPSAGCPKFPVVGLGRPPRHSLILQLL